MAGAVPGDWTTDRRDTFESLALPHYSAVLRHALRLTRHEQDAEDLCQETYLRAFRRFGALESSDAVRPWLLRIATNAFIGIYRRWRRRQEAVWSPDDVERRADEAVGVEVPESPAAVAVHGEVLAAVETLPVAFREAVTLVDLGETTYEEAAEILACPVGTVMSRLHRGRALLRERLAAYAAESGYTLAA
ncbi:MAG: sigma-70 family RNA polymerase sigma factor [Myxococcales bacterium]|nr:sigma-70 family RNA polymerase sigma factor [Myxococcales bacterium]